MGLTAKALRKYPSKLRKHFNKKKLLWRACISEDEFEAVVVDVFSITSRCRFTNRYRKPLYDSSGVESKYSA